MHSPAPKKQGTQPGPVFLFLSISCPALYSLAPFPHLYAHIHSPGLPLTREPQQHHRRVSLGDSQREPQRVPLQRSASAAAADGRAGGRVGQEGRRHQIRVIDRAGGASYRWKTEGGGGRRGGEPGRQPERARGVPLQRRAAVAGGWSRWMGREGCTVAELETDCAVGVSRQWKRED